MCFISDSRSIASGLDRQSALVLGDMSRPRLESACFSVNLSLLTAAVVMAFYPTEDGPAP